MTPVVAKKTYFTVWAALLMLVLLTWGSVYLPLGSMNVVINLVIAAVKALLVMFFFMHLWSSHALIRVMTFGALFWLVILGTLSLSDFLSR